MERDGMRLLTIVVDGRCVKACPVTRPNDSPGHTYSQSIGRIKGQRFGGCQTQGVLLRNAQRQRLLGSRGKTNTRKPFNGGLSSQRSFASLSSQPTNNFPGCRGFPTRTPEKACSRRLVSRHQRTNKQKPHTHAHHNRPHQKKSRSQHG
jgi:hypothetical protein